MLGVTLAPTIVRAGRKINVLPSTAELQVDCRVPPGLDREAILARIHGVLGGEGYRLDGRRGGRRQRVAGRHGALRRDRALGRRPRRGRPDGALRAARLHRLAHVPRPRSRSAWPTASSRTATWTSSRRPALLHAKDERIDVRDLGFAATCYRDLVRERLGG